MVLVAGQYFARLLPPPLGNSRKCETTGKIQFDEVRSSVVNRDNPLHSSVVHSPPSPGKYLLPSLVLSTTPLCVVCALYNGVIWIIRSLCRTFVAEIKFYWKIAFFRGAAVPSARLAQSKQTRWFVRHRDAAYPPTNGSYSSIILESFSL